MRVELLRPHLSLVDLPPSDLPPFTLLTGVNGAGKSHLLQALQIGAARADIAPNSTTDVRLFDWSSLTPPDEGDFDPATLRQERIGIFNQLDGLRRSQPWGNQQLQTTAYNLGIRGKPATDFLWLSTATPEQIARETGKVFEEATGIRQSLDNTVSMLTQNLLNHLQPNQREAVQEISNTSARPLIALTYEDFARTTRPSWGGVDLFRQSFARLFVAYRELYQMNRLAEMEHRDRGGGVPFLTRDAFNERFGRPPWDFVNESLKAAGLDFTIDAPDIFTTSPYRPRLHKSNNGTEISFSGLSSGEKVLMSFAFAVYYASDDRQSITKPKLLLLDEVDAPLHPSMCRSLLSTVQDVLVAKYGLSVILTTHSPSTVALAPDDAIHVMRPGVPGIHRVSKPTALSGLTDGVPTLSFSYDGRRQVFVESPRDVEVYQAAYGALATRINSEVTLNFIATGVEDSSGQHRNTGCVVVKRIVRDIRAAGAQHTFGLIDWDGENGEEDGIFVLAPNARDGLESVLFDPRLLLQAIARQVGVSRVAISWPAGSTYMSIGDLNATTLQLAVDEIQSVVLGRTRGDSVQVEYLDGVSLSVDREYMVMNDHDLEDKVMSSYPELKVISRGRIGELAKWIAGTIMLERPGHTPKCLLDVLARLVAA